MRTALICHHDNPLNREVLPRFMGTFSDLAGVVVIRERPGRMKKRLLFEWRRSRLRWGGFAAPLWSAIRTSSIGRRRRARFPMSGG